LQHYGSSRIKAAVLEEIIPDGIEKALKQSDIQAIGQPQLRSSFDDLLSNYVPGQPLTIIAVIDVQPEVNLQQYTNLSVKAEEIKYDEQQVQKVLDQERQRIATLVPVDGRTGEANEESSEPEPIPGGVASDFKVELQQESGFIPGFVDGIVGMSSGETKEILAQFPADYGNQALAGKKALFTVTIQEIKEKELPELNDEFAQEVSEFSSFAELQASLEERYRKEAQERTKTNQREAVLKEILKYVEVELPETLIDNEVDVILQQTAAKLTQQGLDVKKLFTQDVISYMRGQARPEAIDRIKRGLTLRAISQRESIQVSETEVELKLTEVLAEFRDENIDIDQVRLLLRGELLSEKVFDWLLEHSKVELVAEGLLPGVGEQGAGEQGENNLNKLI
jgi:trigger factor